MLVDIASRKCVYDLTEKQLAKIKEDLSLPNPAYENAVKYSPYNTVAVPEFLNYYEETDEGLFIPRGYPIPFSHTIEEDNRYTCTVTYPPFLLSLRDPQKGAVEAFIKQDSDGIVVIPTGGGKSIYGIYMAAKLKQRTLIIVQKDDLMAGWRDDIMLALRLRPKQIGKIKAKEFRLGEQITLATIQTLAKLPEEKLEILRNYFSFIIFDECHHSPASSYMTILNTFPAKHRLGLTATDMRNDGLREAMGFYLGDVIYRYGETNDNLDIIPPEKVTIKIRTIEEVVYSPPQTYVNYYGRETQYADIGGKRVYIPGLSWEEIEEYVQQGLIRKKPLEFHKVRQAISNNEDYNNTIIKDVIREQKLGKSILCFCFEKMHCRSLYDLLIENWIAEDKIQLYYGDSTESKDTMKTRAETVKGLITIATYAIATEGTSVKAWERIFLCSSLGNSKDTIQAIGRGRRSLKGKSELIVYDYATPNVRGVGNHILTRKKTYNEIGFNIESNVPVFSRGNDLIRKKV